MLARLFVKLLLVVAAYGLWTWNADLDAREAEERLASNRVGRLVEESERDAMQVAAVSVTSGTGDSYLYARVGGLWRCLDHDQAVANEGKVTSLVQAILEAEGVARSDDVERFADYGIGTPEGFEVALHGSNVMVDPERDVQFRLFVGLPVEGLDGCYVRRADRDVVWAVDTDPRALLVDHREGLPPLLDLGVLPDVWPGPGVRIDKIQVEHAGEAPYQLELREVEITPEEMQRGLSPYKWWMLRPGVEAVECHPMLSTAFTVFLRQAEWLAVVPREKANTMGLDLPAARVALATSDGNVTQLVFGAVLADGRVPMYSTFSDSVVLIDEPASRLLAPAFPMLLPGAPINPWDLALKR